MSGPDSFLTAVSVWGGVIVLFTLFSLFLSWLEQREECKHDHRKGYSPALDEFRKLLNGEVTIEEYRKMTGEAWVSTCLDCGEKL